MFGVNCVIIEYYSTFIKLTSKLCHCLIAALCLHFIFHCIDIDNKIPLTGKYSSESDFAIFKTVFICYE